MPRITYQNERVVDVDTATTILQASVQSGIPHTHVCGGNARCSTCRVLILEGLECCSAPNEKERALAELRRFSPNIRLACQTTVTGDVTLRRLVLDEDDLELVDQEVSAGRRRSLGEERRLAILFSDIRDFTALSETLPPYDVIHALNRYFNQMGSIIHRHRGQVDNFMGDGLLALFGLGDPAAAPVNAVHAGLDMLRSVEAMQAYWEAQFGRSLRVGIGLHFGDVVVGAVGRDDWRRITAIGDAVNVASRIQEATKELRTAFLISREAYEQVREVVRVGRRFERELKGKAGKCCFYEVTGLSSQAFAISPIWAR